MPYSLGCPVWACEHWRGSLFTRNAKRQQWLSQYSAVFNSVEGNSTFYALPSIETAQRWAESTSSGFEFCLKVPRAITHDRQLTNVDNELRTLIAVLETLHKSERLGPTFLQLPPGFDRTGFVALETFLNRWPTRFPLAAEVRHADWFDNGPVEAALDNLLRRYGHDRVLFDSRALYARPPQTPAEEISQTRKPRSPFRQTITGMRPFVRFIGRDDVQQVEPWIEEWAETTASWIRQGLYPYIFTHSPDDTFAPAFARLFHIAVSKRVDGLPELPPFPGEQEPAEAQQLSLF